MSQYKRVFIIGHPGAGKALVAKTLAEKLGWQFIDADLGLEFRMGRTLTEIVGKHGEEAFYACQSELLANQINQEHIIVTTDASIVCSEKNRQLLSTECVVYLKVSTSVQLERDARQPSPLLLNTELKAFIDRLHLERDGLYDQVASLTISSDDNALEKHVLRILNTVLDVKYKESIIRPLKLNKKDLTIFHKTEHVPVQLTDQQAACLKLLAQGKAAKEIARTMNISYRTVEDYLAKTMELLGCTSSKELIALYHDQP
jgi:shikimate kinase